MLGVLLYFLYWQCLKYSCKYLCCLFLTVVDPKYSKILLLTTEKNAQDSGLPDTTVAPPHLLYSHSFSIQTHHFL